MINMEKMKNRIKTVHYLFMEKISLKENFYQEFQTKTHFFLCLRIISLKKRLKKEAMKIYIRKLFKDK